MFSKTLIIFLAVFVSCTSAKKSNSVSSQEKNDSLPPAEKYKALAVEKYKDQIEYVFNESKTYVLCVHAKKTSVAHPQNTIRFFIYDLKNENVLYEESVADGSVTWVNDRQLEVIQITGTVTKENPDYRQGYIFDLDTQKKLELSKKSFNLKQ